MSILNENQLLGAPAGSSQYQIQRSLRFNSADSAYLSRTPASAGNRKTWTWSGWVKRSALGSGGAQSIFAAFPNTANGTVLRFTATDELEFFNFISSVYTGRRISTSLYRDPSAWYHIVLVWDSTNATTANRIRLYVNGSELTAFSTSGDPSSSDSFVNANTNAHYIGGDPGFNSQYVSGYLADIHFIDGQALTPASFGETDATTGEWIPKAYTGTYGTNGFKLNFSNNSAATATTLGADSSGNGNNWTPTNLSVTAGAGNDSLVDTPTSYGTDTGVGGEVRGNYCTLNPLTGLLTLVNGNLEASTPPTTSQHYPGRGSIYVNSGKWYWEIQSPTVTSSVPMRIGIAGPEVPASTDFASYTQGYAYLNNGNKQNNSTGAAYGASYSNDIIGVALDLDAGTLVFYKNGVSQGTAYTGISGSFAPAISVFGNQTSGNTICNFGQRQWAYAPPAGFKALCDTNLTAPTIVKPSTVMDVKLYAGDSSTRTLTGLGFSPELVWIKNRTTSNNHIVTDIVRGANNTLYTNTTNAAVTNEINGYLSAFTSDGFTVTGGSTSYTNVNSTGSSYAAWCWDAGSSTVTNTAGTIQSSVRANASAGFSIVTYTGTGANATVGHGLGVAPRFLVVKSRSDARDWLAYHDGYGATKYTILNGTLAAQLSTSAWNNTSPTSSVFSIGNAAEINTNAFNYVAYCFAPVAGYSAFGSYTGNGSSDGPFVYTGFRPRWIMIKSSSALQDWVIKDTARSAYNVAIETLASNSSNAETTVAGNEFDVLSNGFKLRSTGGNYNTNAGTYIYAAFAEFPFQYARAR